MPEYFLMLTIGYSLVTTSPSSSTSMTMKMQEVGPLTQEVCQAAADALRKSQNVIQAACGTKIGMQPSFTTQTK